MAPVLVSPQPQSHEAAEVAHKGPVTVKLPDVQAGVQLLCEQPPPQLLWQPHCSASFGGTLSLEGLGSQHP